MDAGELNDGGSIDGTSIPSIMLQKTGISCGLMGNLARTQTSPFQYKSLQHKGGRQESKKHATSTIAYRRNCAKEHDLPETPLTSICLSLTYPKE